MTTQTDYAKWAKKFEQENGIAPYPMDAWLAQAAEIERLREALITLTYACQKSRIWGGMEWVYHPVHPHRYLPALDAARAALGEANDSK